MAKNTATAISLTLRTRPAELIISRGQHFLASNCNTCIRGVRHGGGWAYEISKSSGFLDFVLDFRISRWISGFLVGFLDFVRISGFLAGFPDFALDFWISSWISGFQVRFLDFALDFWISRW